MLRAEQERNTIETTLTVDETVFPPTKFERATSQTPARPQLHTGSVRQRKSALVSRKIRISRPKFLEPRWWVQVRFCSTHGEGLYDAAAAGRSIQNNSALN